MTYNEIKRTEKLLFRVFTDTYLPMVVECVLVTLTFWYGSSASNLWWMYLFTSDVLPTYDFPNNTILASTRLIVKWVETSTYCKKYPGWMQNVRKMYEQTARRIVIELLRKNRFLSNWNSKRYQFNLHKWTNLLQLLQQILKLLYLLAIGMLKRM